MLGEGPWLVLSHQQAQSPVGEVWTSYIHAMTSPTPEERSLLKTITHAWWASFPQYEAFVDAIPELKQAQHFCGLGKTYSSFQQHKISVTALTDHKEFLSLVGLT
jgi:hypothetical protein